MFRRIYKWKLSKWCLLMLILSPWFLLGTSRSKRPQSTNEDKKPYTEQIKKELSQEPDERKRQDILLVMVDYDDVGAFESVLNAMMNDSARVRETAVRLISHYYVRIPYYADDSSLVGITFPEQIASQYEMVVDQLNHLVEGTRYIDLKLAACRSLLRMGAASEATLDELYEIAIGVGKESWERTMCGGGTREDMEMMSQKDAIGLIVTMNHRHIFEEKTKDYLKSIMNRLEPGSRLFKMIEGPVRKTIGQKSEGGAKFSAPSYAGDGTYHGVWAAEYGEQYCREYNSFDPNLCDWFMVFDRDCANFASQCLMEGHYIGLHQSFDEDANCGCIVSAHGLYDSLREYSGCVEYMAAVGIVEEENPNSCIPGTFSEGDIVILERTIDPYKGRMHAIICVGPSGHDAIFVAHSSDRCLDDQCHLSFFIGTGSNSFQNAYFFHILPECGTDATVEQFFVLDDMARWMISSEARTRGYIVEGSNSSNGPWTQCTAVCPPSRGSYSVSVSNSGYSFFRLVEIASGDQRIIHEISKARSHVKSRSPTTSTKPSNTSDLRKQLDILRSEWKTNTVGLPSRTVASGGEKYVIFTVPAFEAIVQSYVAEFWESRGYDADIILVPGYPANRDSVRSSIKSMIAAYADTASAKYFHLIGDANDWREFTGDISSNYWVSGWEDIREGYLNYPSCYPDSGQRPLDLIPTFVIPDTLPRGANMATSSPYWFSDQPYADVDDDGIPDVVITRWPVSDSLQVLAMALKMQTHMLTEATGTQKKVAFYVGDRNWYCENCGVGDRERMLADSLEALMLETAPGQDVEHIYETDYPDVDSLNTGAANLWNAFEPQLVVMVAGRSNRYLPASYFSKASGTNPFDMDMITVTATPFVIGGTCGTADWATTEDPNFGRPVCEEFLTEPGKGAVAWLGPSKGTWAAGNKAMLLSLIEELFSDQHRPLAESWLLAMQQIYSAFADVKPILDVASSYMFLGDPLSPFTPIPRGRVTTFVRTQYADSLVQSPEWCAVGCPQGDADTLVVVVEINANDVQLPIPVEAITISQPQDSSIILFSALHADSAPTLSEGYYKTTISITEFSGCGRDSAGVYLYDYNLGYAQLNVRSPDVIIIPGSCGQVDLLDYGEFGMHFQSSICDCYYAYPYSACVDYVPPADTTVNTLDFGIFGTHYNHETSGGSQVSPSDYNVSSASIKLSFSEDNPVSGPRKLYADITMDNYEPFKAVVMSFRNSADFLEYSNWHSNEDYAGRTMCAEVIRNGKKEILLGIMGSEQCDGKTLTLGRIEFDVATKDSIALSEDDLSLVFADLLETNGQKRIVLTSDIQKTFEPTIFHNELEQNYPNPFNPTTTIRYSIKQRTHVSLRIFNVAGQLVRTLVDREMSPEEVKPIVWDGRNDKGQTVASGIYFYRLKTREFSKTRKLMMLK